METITLNKSIGRTRRETLGGREYIVAPLSMLVPGVLNGSRGPLLYPPELVNRNPAVWNHMPIVVYHPMEQGKPTSARDPYILNKQGIGFVFRSRENGRAEGWFDVENTKRVDPRVYDALVKNRPMELSTGLFTKNSKAPDGSSFKGKAYVEIVRDFTPDHLAILPDQKGACSMKDGCGMLINKDQTNNRDWSESKRDKLPSKDFAGPNQSFPITTQEDVDAAAKLIGHADNPEAVKARIIKIAKRKGLTLPESWQTNNSSALNKAQQIVGNLNPLHPLQPRKKGKFIGKPEARANEGASNDSHETVKNMQEPGDTTKLANKLAQLVKNLSNKDDHSGSSKSFVKGEPTMAKVKKPVVNEEPVDLTDDDREELIDMIVGNCECDTAMDKETLNGLSDELLSRLAINAMSPEMMKKKKSMMTKAEAEDMMDEGAEEDQEDAEGNVIPSKKKPTQNQACKGKGKPPVKKDVTVNRNREETPILDPKTQFLVNYAERKMQEEKDILIEKLTANLDDDDKEEYAETLNEEPIEKLEMMVKLLPKEEKREPVQNNRLNTRGRSNLREERSESKGRGSYVGAGGALPRSQAKQVNNGQRKSAEDDDPLAGPLESPTINYAEIAGYNNGNFIHRNHLGSMASTN